MNISRHRVIDIGSRRIQEGVKILEPMGPGKGKEGFTTALGIGDNKASWD